MRRLAFIVLAALATIPAPLSSPLPAAAASACTGWASTTVPPSTIRVLRTTGPASGRVQQVDFRAYVDNVMAWEWPASWPRETLRAGAVAVKQYGWYYARVWRGGRAADGACYDVVDSTRDQLYRPEDRTTASALRAAVAATWLVSLRKGGTFILTGYRAGSAVPCGSNADGGRLYQWSARDCGLKGLTYESILRRYYSPDLFVVTPGQQHAAGTYQGDAAAVLRGSVEGRIRPALWPSTGAGLTASLPGPDIVIAPQRRRGYAAADVTGDGREDFVYLIRDGVSAERVAVAPATGTGYGSSRSWWSSAVEGPALAMEQDGIPSLHLAAGDFDGDGRDDAALVSLATATRPLTVSLLPSLGTDFRAMTTIYEGAGPQLGARVGAGDVNGDGRADVILETDLGAGGVRFTVLPSAETRVALGPPTTWLETTTIRRSGSTWTVGDVDRDGRDDVLALYQSSTGPRLTALLSRGGTFARDHLWTAGAAADDPTDARRMRVGRADLNGDGAVDTLGFVDAGDGTVHVDAWLTNGLAAARTRWLTSVPTAWSDVAPF